MKKIVNDVNNVEEEMIQGLVKSAPKKLRKLDYGTIVVRADKKEGKVALVSGGGSGHEPAHAGYVGTVMLAFGYLKLLAQVFKRVAAKVVLVASGTKGAIIVYVGGVEVVKLQRLSYARNIEGSVVCYQHGGIVKVLQYLCPYLRKIGRILSV